MEKAMYGNMRHAILVGVALLGMSVSALATKDVTQKFSKPTNKGGGSVTVGYQPDPNDPKTWDFFGVPIDPNTSAEGKRDLVYEAMKKRGYDVEKGAEGNELKVKYLRDGSKLKFWGENTGEGHDVLAAASTPSGVIEFANVFDPFDWDRQPAIFTGGIVTDVGELSVQISAEELNFQTDGPIICQALFQRLAPRAPQYGAQINYAGDRLEIYFDPAYTITQGGVVFGTTSPTPGSGGEILLGGEEKRCPGDTNGDGVVDQVDLAKVLAAYGTRRGDQGFDPEADVNGDGTVDQSDLAEVLAHYGERCK
jgi:hypothetical protein